MKIVKAEVKDASEVARLSLLLWPEHDIEEIERGVPGADPNG